MGLLAKKDRENQEDKDRTPEKNQSSGSSGLQQDHATSSNENQSKEPKTDVSTEQPIKKQKKQKTNKKMKKRGKKF